MKKESYNYLKNILYKNNSKIDINDVIKKVKKYYHVDINKANIYNIVGAVASGKIVSINQIRFMKKILDESPKEKNKKINSRLESLLSEMIKTFNNDIDKNLYVNAEISFKNFKNYQKILNTFEKKDDRRKFKNSITDSIDINKIDNNTAFILNQKYNYLKSNIKNNEPINNLDLLFMQKYSELFDRTMLQTICDVVKLKSRFIDIEQNIVYSENNVFLEIIRNYLERLEIYLINSPYSMKENDLIKNELKFINNKFGINVSSYNKLILESAERDKIKKEIAIVKDFIKEGSSVSVKAFCNKYSINYNILKKYSEYTNDKVIISLVEYRIQKQIEEEKVTLEKEYELLRKHILNLNDDFNDFEVINYFSITDKKVDYMIKYALNKKDNDLVNKLMRFLSIYEEDLKKFSFKDYNIDAKTINVVMAKINEEGYPRLVGIVKKAMVYNNKLELNNFTKENFIRQYESNLKSKKRVI